MCGDRDMTAGRRSKKLEKRHLRRCSVVLRCLLDCQPMPLPLLRLCRFVNLRQQQQPPRLRRAGDLMISIHRHDYRV